jgi:hypothetical protein
MFQSSELLKRIIGDRSLDDAAKEIGISGSSALFRIEVEDGGAEFNLGGCVSVHGDGDHPDLQLTLMRDFE